VPPQGVHWSFEAWQKVLASVHLPAAQHVSRIVPHVVQLPMWQTVSMLVGLGASHWAPSATQVPPPVPAA
jgi:hypothetical protein